MDDLELKIKELISWNVGVKMEEIEMNSNFVEDFGMDSLDIVELQMSIEEKFNIEISDKEIEKISTVQECINLVNKKVTEKESEK